MEESLKKEVFDPCENLAFGWLLPPVAQNDPPPLHGSAPKVSESSCQEPLNRLRTKVSSVVDKSGHRAPAPSFSTPHGSVMTFGTLPGSGMSHG